MKKIILFIVIAGFISLFSNQVQAQQYKNAFGVRLGSYNGVNFKTFLTDKNALDFNLSFRSNDGVKYVRVTGLYEVHGPVSDLQGLLWYYGGGASIGSYKYRGTDGELMFSIDGVLGLDYKFTGAPINLALDWRPNFRLTPNADVLAGDVGLSVRFTF